MGHGCIPECQQAQHACPCPRVAPTPVSCLGTTSKQGRTLHLARWAVWGSESEPASLPPGTGDRVDRDRGKGLGSGTMCFGCTGRHVTGSCHFPRMSGVPGSGWSCLCPGSLILPTTQRDSSPPQPSPLLHQPCRMGGGPIFSTPVPSITHT